uniref:Uncharacterized protein n=1 Tax=Rhizophora mucronata TaxID=61149 RepID=A0A2P2PG99_RHIMU
MMAICNGNSNSKIVLDT